MPLALALASQLCAFHDEMLWRLTREGYRVAEMQFDEEDRRIEVLKGKRGVIVIRTGRDGTACIIAETPRG